MINGSGQKHPPGRKTKKFLVNDITSIAYSFARKKNAKIFCHFHIPLGQPQPQTIVFLPDTYPNLTIRQCHRSQIGGVPPI